MIKRLIIEITIIKIFKMPERAEIMIMSNQLNDKLKDSFIESVIFFQRSKYYNSDLYSSMSINGNKTDKYKQYNIDCKVYSVQSYGKKIIFILRNLQGQELRIISTCAMTGSWKWKPSNLTCIALITDKETAYFEEIDELSYFSVCLYPSLEYNKIFDKLGPDCISDSFTFDLFQSSILSEKYKNKEICELLIDQSFIAGIGNYLRSEILFRSKINPYRIPISLSLNQLHCIFYFIKYLVIESYNKGGLTIRDYTDTYSNPGVFETLCYSKREYQGNQIITEISKNGQKIHYCPNLQMYDYNY